MLSPIGESVRRHDPDRFLTALFAPPAHRETLFVLYAFNHELARAREVASEPTLALIRLQWWRETVEGAPRRHELAGPLRAAIDAGALDPAPLLAMIEGREIEADPEIPDRLAWSAYLQATAGEVMLAAGRALGAAASDAARLRQLGAAYGAAGVLRSIGAVARQGRCLLPRDSLASHGLQPEEVIAAPADPRLRPVVAALAAEGQAMLRTGPGPALPRGAVAAVLPAILAMRDLRRLRTWRGDDGRAGGRRFGDRLAVTLAGLRPSVCLRAFGMHAVPG